MAIYKVTEGELWAEQDKVKKLRKTLASLLKYEHACYDSDPDSDGVGSCVYCGKLSYQGHTGNCKFVEAQHTLEETE